MTPLEQKYGKTPRLYRDVIITEKLDGTNASVIIRNHVDVFWEYRFKDETPNPLASVGGYGIWAASRNRLLTTDNDNYGFAAWVEENGEALINTLGAGRFSGEWFGQGIQKNPYGLGEKVFALFRTDLRQIVDESFIDQLDTVPVLYEGPFSDRAVHDARAYLMVNGSQMLDTVAPFYPGEGVCIYHKDSGQVFKVTHDDRSKEARG